MENKKIQQEWVFPQASEKAEIVAYDGYDEYRHKDNITPTIAPTLPTENTPTLPNTRTDKNTDITAYDSPTKTPTYIPTESITVLFVDDKDARFIRNVSRITLRIVGVGVCVGVGFYVVEAVVGVAAEMMVVVTEFVASCIVLAKQGLMILLVAGGIWVALMILRMMNNNPQNDYKMPNGEGVSSPHNIQVTINTGNNVTQHNQ
jgi:hypothetical protein